MILSVAIITRNRPEMLDRCIESILTQSEEPEEIVVVDSSDIPPERTTRSKPVRIRIMFRYLPGRSIPEARNEAVRRVAGQIIFFLDDDCVAGKDCIRTAKEFFRTNRNCDILAGHIENALPGQPAACVQQAYYDRWLREITGNPARITRIDGGCIPGFDIVAMKRQVAQAFPFSTGMAYGLDEDIEFSRRVISAGKRVYYHPELLAFHANRRNFRQLAERTFKTGMANRQTERMTDISMNDVPHPVPLAEFFRIARRNSRKLAFINRIEYWGMLMTNPVFYRLGRWSFRFRKIL